MNICENYYDTVEFKHIDSLKIKFIKFLLLDVKMFLMF